MPKVKRIKFLTWVFLRPHRATYLLSQIVTAAECFDIWRNEHPLVEIMSVKNPREGLKLIVCCKEPQCPR